VATSPDGSSLFAASSKDDGIARFDRDPSGALTYRDCTSGEIESGPSPAGSGACAKIPSAASGGTNSGLSSPRSLVASPDGTSLYAGARDDDAVARFDREVAGGGGPPPEAPNDFSFGKVKKNKRKGTAKLTVNVPGAGELDLAKTRKVQADDESAEDAGKEKLLIKPKGKVKKKLNTKGKAKVKANVTFTPEGGEPRTESKKVGLKKR
jgi:hypothetical protein